MNEATRQYEKYCETYAERYRCSVEYAKSTAICEEYRQYCENVHRDRVCEEK